MRRTQPITKKRSVHIIDRAGHPEVGQRDMERDKDMVFNLLRDNLHDKREIYFLPDNLPDERSVHIIDLAGHPVVGQRDMEREKGIKIMYSIY